MQDTSLGPHGCPETAEGPPARVVAAGGPALRSGRRRVQRLQKGLRRALSAVSGAVFRDCRRASGARGRRWGPGSLRSVQRLQKGLRRAWSLLGVRLSPQCRRRVQRLQKGQKGLRRAWSPLEARLSGAVFRDCRRGCGARGRRWGPGSLRSVRRSVQRLQKGLRRAWSPLGARYTAAKSIENNAALRCRTTDGVRFSKELTLTKFVSDIDTSDVLC